MSILLFLFFILTVSASGMEISGQWTQLNRPDRSGARLFKEGNTLRLSGMAVSERIKDVKGKTFIIRVRARGTGILKLMLFEYRPGASNIEMTALVIHANLTTQLQEYTGKVTIPGWHGENEMAVALDVVSGEAEIERLTVDSSASGMDSQKTPMIVTLPKLTHPIDITGNFNPGKWKESVHFINSFRDQFSGENINSQSEVRLASDGTNLYVLLMTQIPKGGFRLRQTRRDSEVWTDESLELVVNPNCKSSDPAEVYQIVISYAGVVFDQKLARGIGQNIVGYNCPGLKVKSGFYQGYSVLEVAVPLTSVGITSPDQVFGLTVGRNHPLMQGASSLSGAPFQDFKSMMRVAIAPDAPALRFGPEKLDDSGHYRFLLHIQDPTDRYLSRIRDADRKIVKDGDFTGERKESLNISGEVDSASGNPVFRGFAKLRRSAYGIQEPAFSNGSTLYIEYYCFQKKLNLRTDKTTDELEKKVKNVRFIIIEPTGGKAVQIVPRGPVIGNAFDTVIPVDFKTDGDYLVHAELLDRNGNILSQVSATIPVKKLEWVGNKIGKDELVLPPFSKMEYPGDNTIAYSLRTYQFADGGFPAAITADGEELLNAPAGLTLLSPDGKRIEGIPGKFQFTRKTPTRAEFISSIEYPEMKLQITGWTEYDGIIYYTLKITPERAPVAVGKLFFSANLKKADMFHFSNDAIRGEKNYFYADDFPVRNGVVWDSTSVKNHRVYGNFISSLWLGNFHRGLSFFAESERGWHTFPDKPCVKLFRKDQSMSLIVNLLTGPFLLEKERSLQFGLIATPVKPKPTGISARMNNRWQTSFGMGYFNAGLHSLDPWVSNQMIRRDNGAAYLPYSAGNEYVYGDPEIKYFKDEPATVPKGFYTGTLSEVPFMAMGPDVNNYVSIKMSWTPQQVDFRLWRLKKLFESTGIDGVYLDNSFPVFNFNLQVPNGGFLRDDGKLQGTFPVLLMREYLKRSAMLAHRHGKRSPAIIVHNTNSQIIAAFTFADGTYDGEMSMPKGGHYEVFYPAWLDISLGVNWGVPAGMLTMTGWEGNNTLSEAKYRSMYSIFKLYDIAVWSNGKDYPLKSVIEKVEREFGVTENDCKFVGYWENTWVKLPNGLKCSYFIRKGKKALLYVANPMVTTITGEIVFSGGKGSQMDKLHVTDAETMKNIPGTHRISIPARDFKILIVENEGTPKDAGRSTATSRAF